MILQQSVIDDLCLHYYVLELGTVLPICDPVNRQYCVCTVCTNFVLKYFIIIYIILVHFYSTNNYFLILKINMTNHKWKKRKILFKNYIKSTISLCVCSIGPVASRLFSSFYC